MSAELEILAGLESSEISFRISAIERASLEGVSEKVMQALIDRIGKEKERDLVILMSHAISQIRQQLDQKPFAKPKKPLEFKSDDFFSRYAHADPAGKLALLAHLQPAEKNTLKAHAPALLEKETQPLVSAAIIRTFGPHWPEEYFKNLSNNLASKSLCLRLATLEILVQKVPRELSKSLPKFLVSPDPRIRGLAIRGLAALDMNEALVHHQFLLSSPHKNDRIIALENSVYFPFDKIKPMLIRFLAKETDSSLLMKGGLLFAINPDIEVPYRLWEMIDLCSPEKTVILKSVANDACKALEKSGRLPPKEYRAYMDNLDHWVQQKMATRFVQDCVGKLLADSEETQETEALIQRSIENPKTRKAFEAAMDWPLNEKTRNRLQKILGTTGISPADLPEEVTPGDSDPAGFRNKIRKVALLQNKNRKAAREEIRGILSSEDSPPFLIASAIRAAIRLEMADFTAQALEMVHSSNPAISAPAIEYLNQFCFEKILPLLRTFIRTKPPRIKAAAIRALKIDDPQAALESLKTLLLQSSPEEQSAGLACSIHFDFPLIREMLAEYLSSNPTQELFRNGLCLFSANPAPENLFTLFALEQTAPEENRNLVREVRKNCETFLVRNRLNDEHELGELEAKFPELWALEQEKKVSEPAPYSLQALRSFFDQPEEDDPQSLFYRFFSWIRSFWNR